MVTDHDRAKASALAKHAVEVCRAVLEAIEASGTFGVPSGHLYAFLAPVLTIDQYNTIINVLVKSGRVRKSNHVLYATLAEL